MVCRWVLGLIRCVAGLVVCHLLLASTASHAGAQTWVEDTLTVKGLTSQPLKRKNLIPFSESVKTSTASLTTADYEIDYFAGLIVIKTPALVGQQLFLKYKVFDRPAPGSFGYSAPVDSIQKADSAKSDSQNLAWLYKLPEPRLGLPKTDTTGEGRWNAEAQLQRSGSISRAVTVGSGRDAAITSDFRLNLAGTVSDDIEIGAAITDQNLPIQPSGTTQELSDFDQIFIQLKRKKTTLTFGDVELKQTGLRFGNLYRDVLGLQYQFKDSLTNVTFAGASSKGNFTSNSFSGQVGKQGPYRLTGKDGEQFVTILAGSERVYLNGRILTRGQDQDYIIDYNTGELTFTPRHALDANTRIVIDFEYQVRNYARSFLLGSYQGQLFDKKLSLRVSIGREADDPTNPLNATLTEADKDSLAQAGDNPTLAVTSGIDSVGYTAGQIRYAVIDTTVGTVLYQGVLVRSSNPEIALYQASFTFVGTGKGDYVRESSLVNGNSFRWSPPNEAGKTGDYAPVRFLPFARSLEVADIEANYKISDRISVFTETAFSKDDVNRFSSLDDQDNNATASRSGIRLTALPIGKSWKLSTEGAFQYVEPDFQNFDRVYEREYGRVWNYNDLAARDYERIAELSATALYKTLLEFRTSAGTRSYGDSLRTVRYSTDIISKDTASILGTYNITYLETQNRAALVSSKWLRQTGELYRQWGKKDSLDKVWQVGSSFWLERKRDTKSDTLVDGTFEFADVTPFLRSTGADRKLKIDLSFNLRFDRAFALERGLIDKSRTLKPSFGLVYQPTPRFTISSRTTWLRYNVLDTSFTRTQNIRSQETWLQDLQAGYSSKKQGFRISAFYRAATEQVARRSQSFVEVAAGQGQYEWLDYNEDGIQDLNEFELSSNPLLANYIRILNPTQELFPAVSVSAGGSLNIDFSRTLAKKPNWPAKLLYKMISQTNLRATQQADRPSSEVGSYRLRLDAFSNPDTTILASALSFRQDIYFFRNDPVGDLSFGYLLSDQRQLLNSGFEGTRNETWSARQRYNLGSNKSLDNNLQWGTRSRLAENFSNARFDIQIVSVSPAFNLQASRKVRLTAGYTYSYKENKPLEETISASSVISHRLTIESRFNLKARNSLVGRINLLNNALTGTAEGSLRYELLESLESGRNAVWNLLLIQYLSESLELSVVYDGRSSQNTPTQHAIRMQLKAIF